jgi:hypothetical protein
MEPALSDLGSLSHDRRPTCGHAGLRHIQSRLPDALIRRLLGILVLAIGARYLWAGLA